LLSLDNSRLTLSDAYSAARNSGFSGLRQKPKFRPICGADPAPMPFPRTPASRGPRLKEVPRSDESCRRSRRSRDSGVQHL
jgi:hypothetical protein